MVGAPAEPQTKSSKVVLESAMFSNGASVPSARRFCCSGTANAGHWPPPVLSALLQLTLTTVAVVPMLRKSTRRGRSRLLLLALVAVIL